MKSVSRWLAVGLGLVAAAALAISVEAGMWWSVGEVTIGPFGSHHCFTGDCRGSGLAWIGGSDLWMRGAIATGVACVLASFLLVVLAGAAAAGRAARLAARMVLVSLASAVACGIYFVVGFPGVRGAHLGLGMPLFCAGIVAGAAAAIIVARTPRAA